ncbi:MAG TPA: cell surface lipoprotein [Methanosarcina sp.]|nr:cell surface lipoprotein [Methanosarcina sp.]
MTIKKLVLLLIVISVLMSGCLNSGENQEQENKDSGSSGGTQRYEEAQTPEETVTSEETETAEETLTPVIAGGTEEAQTENVTEGGKEAGTEQPAETGPRTYLVRLRKYVFMPSELEINTGDLVVWRNYEDILFILTSEEGLFEDQRLGYGNTFDYTFNETGSYNFSVKGYPNMKMTITVK